VQSEVRSGYKALTARLLHILIGLGVGHLLLLNTEIYPTFSPITPSQVVVSGYGGFNASLVRESDPGEVVISLLIQTGSFSLDQSDVFSFPAFTPSCQGQGVNCSSIIRPGGIPASLDTSAYSNDQSVYIVENAPGLHMEFYPSLNKSSNNTFKQSDCRIYGAGTTALASCLQNFNGTLNFGTYSYRYC
jgi:hypothetical protein